MPFVHRRSLSAVATLATALTLVGAGATPVPAAPATTAAPATDSATGTAASRPHAVTLAKGLVTPLSFVVTRSGTRYYSMNFAGGVFRQAPGRAAVPIYQTTGGAEAGALSVRGGVVTFAVTKPGKHMTSTDTQLMRLGPGGRARVVAQLGAYERSKNPDASATYGFVGLDDQCAASLPKAVGPASYTGTRDSHPYATTSVGGTTYVADAAANAILAVSARGRVSTVAVLPPVDVVITRAAAKANKLPACTVGKTYRFEPVPTDVEVGPGGRLYVSTLPGGPEDGSTGANGGISTVNPRTGRVRSLTTGLLSPVGLAVAGNGDVYVSQLFAGVISRLRAGASRARPYLRAAFPGDVELAAGDLYATTNVLPGKPQDPPAGKLVQILP